jgi:hypothetical protein
MTTHKSSSVTEDSKTSFFKILNIEVAITSIVDQIQTKRFQFNASFTIQLNGLPRWPDE